MTGVQRRKLILEMLTSAEKPVPGHVLAQSTDVSRQVIVQDIALLRTAGHAISSTTRGYVLGGQAQTVRLVKVRHDASRMEEELNIVVDLGGCVLDVMVNHRTYGLVNAALDVKSRRDVRRFLEDLGESVSQPLSSLTDGYHFHHISAESEEVLGEIVAALDAAGLIAPLTEYERETL